MQEATIDPSPSRQEPRLTWDVFFAARAQRLDSGARSQMGGRADASAQTPMGFEAFFHQFEGRITGYLWRMTGDEQVACEMSQETFLRAWQHFDTISTYEQPGAWLYRVATNLALQYLRRRALPVGAAMPIGLDGDPAASDPSVRYVESDLVRQILLSLSPKQRAALVLREVIGLSCDEVGRTLGVTRDAAKQLLWRGREQFRTRYLRAEGED